MRMYNGIMPYKPAKIVLQSSPNIERNSLQNRRQLFFLRFAGER